MNYPNRAREKGLSGSLLLDVAIRSDGSVKEIIIRRSSGHDLLDSGAVKIVRLAAPFAPFPDQIKGEVDILHVTRNWKFVNDQRPTD
jgi:protein TonB